MANNGTTVSIKEHSDVPARKIAKIVPYTKGGFSLIMPYHSSHSGYLTKLPINYDKIGMDTISLDEVIGYTAEHRVKFSYHPDGFAQFSSETQGQLISGRDPTTGKPKGLGVITAPLSNPIRSGPSISVTTWGLGDFDELGQTDSILFTPEEMYYRACTPETANAWVTEFFVFENKYWAGVRPRGNGYVLSISFRDFEASNAVIDMQVIPLLGQPCFLAVFASRIHGDFQSPSGWDLAGPSQINTSTGIGHMLAAFYPRDVHMGINGTSLDRLSVTEA
jgi:hypothetical protein